MFKRIALGTIVGLSSLALLTLTINLSESWFLDRADSVAYITNKKQSAGGTGFHVLGPSGEKYLITNDHVCEATAEDGVVWARLKDSDRSIPRRVIEVSELTDLCIVEPLPQARALSLASEDPEPGQYLSVTGHPRLLPLTTTYGTVIGSIVAKMLVSISPQPGTCSAPKNSIENIQILFWRVPACFMNVSAIVTTIQIMPGNSGSPVFDSYGRVRGVVFASDGLLGWAAMVPVTDLNKFLSSY